MTVRAERLVRYRVVRATETPDGVLCHLVREDPEEPGDPGGIVWEGDAWYRAVPRTGP